LFKKYKWWILSIPLTSIFLWFIAVVIYSLIF
jgi:hypothetical protein